MSTSFVSYSYAQDGYVSELEDEIIVTGSPLVRSVDEAIVGLSVLSGDELADRLGATIGETLKAEPGVSSTFFGAGASRPIIRGQGGDRVRILNNGIGSIDASSASPDHAVAAEPAQAERIEILRGATLLRYGSSGSGGIVNVLDGRIPQNIPEEMEGAIRVGASSVDLGREVAVSLDKPISSNIVMHLDGTWREADDYRIPVAPESRIFHESEEEHEDEDIDFSKGGVLENSFARSQSLTGGVSYVGGNGFLGVATHRFESDYGLPGGHAHGDEEHDEHAEDDHEEEHEDEHGHEHGAEDGVKIDLKQTRIDVNGGLELDGFFEKIQLFAGYADYEHRELEASGVVGTLYSNEGYEIRGEAIQRDVEGWAAAYGVHIRRRDFSAFGEEAFVPPVQTTQMAAYMFHEKDMDDMHIESALRYERVKQDNSSTSNDMDFDLISGSVGGDYHISEGFRLGGTVFRTQRAPTSEELFSNGPHLATGQFEIGDASLDHETATGIETALRYKHKGYVLILNGFYTDYEDFIYETLTDEMADGLPVSRYQSENATFKGFEVQAGAGLGTWKAFDFSADILAEYVQAETDSRNLPRIPPLSILAGMEAESDRFKFRGEIEHNAEPSGLATHELNTEAYSLVNLFASWKAPISSQDVKLKLSILNLFDEEARQHTSFLKDEVPLPGRNVRFAIAASF